MKRSEEELRKLLVEQYSFLIKSCREYDNGDKSEAKRIALHLRILAHNTNKSHGLISQIEVLTMTDLYILSRNTTITNGLLYYVGAMIRMSPGKNEIDYEPMMDLSHPGLRKMNIKDWWNQLVILVNGVSFTRKDVMLSLVDKEGGAHIDPIPSEKFRKLTQGDLIDLQNGTGNKIKGIEKVMARENGFFMINAIKAYLEN